MGFIPGGPRRGKMLEYDKGTDEGRRPEEVDKCVPVASQGQRCEQKHMIAH